MNEPAINEAVQNDQTTTIRVKRYMPGVVAYYSLIPAIVLVPWWLTFGRAVLGSGGGSVLTMLVTVVPLLVLSHVAFYVLAGRGPKYHELTRHTTGTLFAYYVAVFVLGLAIVDTGTADWGYSSVLSGLGVPVIFSITLSSILSFTVFVLIIVLFSLFIIDMKAVRRPVSVSQSPLNQATISVATQATPSTAQVAQWPLVPDGVDDGQPVQPQPAQAQTLQPQSQPAEQDPQGGSAIAYSSTLVAIWALPGAFVLTNMISGSGLLLLVLLFTQIPVLVLIQLAIYVLASNGPVKKRISTKISLVLYAYYAAVLLYALTMALPYQTVGAFITPVFMISIALAVTVIVMLSIEAASGNKLRAAKQQPQE